MSLYIDVRGRLANPGDIEPLIEFVIAGCGARGWPWRHVDDVEEDVYIVPSEGGDPREAAPPVMHREVLHRLGIYFSFHYESETLALVFDTDSGRVLGLQVLTVPPPSAFPFGVLTVQMDPKTGALSNPGNMPAPEPPAPVGSRMVFDWHGAKTVYAGGDSHCHACDFLREVGERFPGIVASDSGGYLKTGKRAESRRIARAHVAAVGVLDRAFAKSPDDVPDRHSRVDPVQSLGVRSTGPFDRLDEEQRATLERGIRHGAAELGFAEVTPENAEAIIAAMDAYLAERKPFADRGSDTELDLRMRFGPCYGACIQALMGGYWEFGHDALSSEDQFLLEGVAVSMARVNPFFSVRTALNHRLRETLADELDGLRFDNESYLATYGQPRLDEGETQAREPE